MIKTSENGFPYNPPCLDLLMSSIHKSLRVGFYFSKAPFGRAESSEFNFRECLEGMDFTGETLFKMDADTGTFGVCYGVKKTNFENGQTWMETGYICIESKFTGGLIS